jgi:hypothetical protein
VATLTAVFTDTERAAYIPPPCPICRRPDPEITWIDTRDERTPPNESRWTLGTLRCSGLEEHTGTAAVWDTEPASVLPYDLHTDPISVAQAAELADVTDDVIRQWIHRKHLTPVDRTPGGRPLLLGIDVLRTKAKLHPPHRRKLQTRT